MMTDLTIREITDKQVWEAFQLRQRLPQFMQSWNAGLLSQGLGEQIVRFGLYDHDKLISTLSASIVRAKRGSYLFIPYGPAMANQTSTALAAWTAHLRAWGKEQKLDFIRCCPFLPNLAQHRQDFAQNGWRLAPIHTLAEDLWFLDLQADEDTLLAGMSKTTRNLIRRAIKDGVTVTRSTDERDVADFLKLHEATKERHHFTAYPDKLFYEQVRVFAADRQVSVLRAEHEGALIASSIIMYYGGMASYHHGASIPSKIPAAYLLQWEGIKEGKRRGCTIYNFWGVTDLKDTKHPFYGISLFKTRFGGYPLSLLRSQDLPLTSRYRLTQIVETIRRIRRGFGLKRS